MGYHRAGWEVVVGVDIEPQSHYCGDDFYQGNALWTLKHLLDGGQIGNSHHFRGFYSLGDFAAIHASPPCQRFSHMTKMRKNYDDHLDLLTPCRELLKKTGLPWVIENVVGAPLRPDLVLCGSMFGLNVKRHRIFEFSFGKVEEPRPCHHLWTTRTGHCVGVYGHTSRSLRGGSRPSGNRGWLKADWEKAMGIDWMTVDELAQAIPPAYTEFVGKQLLKVV